MELGRDHRGDTAPILSIRHESTQVVDGTSASAQSNVIDAHAEAWVRIAAYDDVHIAFGSDPTATASHIYLPQGMVEYFRVKNGYKIAVIGGKINISTAG